MKNRKEAKQYLEDYLRMKDWNFVALAVSPEGKQFTEEKDADKLLDEPLLQGDNFFSWLVKRALECLEKEEKLCGNCLLRRVGDSWCTKYGKKTTIDRKACEEWVCQP